MKPHNFLIVALIACCTAGLASAETVRIRCGSQNFVVDTQAKTLRTDERRYHITWEYDGEWIRMELGGSSSKLAFSSKSGYVLQDGTQIDAGCRFLNPNVLADLPLTETAELRLAFIALPQADRKKVQSNLKANGYYTSAVDGLWGSGTENALVSHLRDVNTDGAIYSIASEAKAEKYIGFVLNPASQTASIKQAELGHEKETQAYAFKKTVKGCNTPASSLGGHKGGRMVMQYIRQSENSFSDSLKTQRQLQSLITRYPNHPALNWQAGWRSYLNNNFDRTIKHLNIAASQGEPNAAFILGYISLGLLDGEDSLKPDKSTKLIPIDMVTAVQCLEVTANSSNLLVYDGGVYSSQFGEAASEILAALYLHDLEYLYGKNSLATASDLAEVPYDPNRANSLVRALSAVEYKELRAKAEAALQQLAADTRRKEEERQRRHEEALKNREAIQEELEKKCQNYTAMKGICWALTIPEMRSVLATRGYRSKPDQKNKFVDANGARIQLKRDRVEFQCGILNACDLSIRELASQIKKAGLIKGSMEFDAESNNLIEGIYSHTNSLCGRGLQGEKVCVVETKTTMGALSGATTSVVLGKGMVGKDVSFE